MFTTLLFCDICVVVTSNQINITAGQNVTLPCRARDNNIPIIVVEWSRADLGKECVLMYRDKQLDPDDQHPSFKNRVDLQDRQMKDGDVSLILKNVTINDTGTYECRVFRRGTNRRKRVPLHHRGNTVISKIRRSLLLNVLISFFLFLYCIDKLLHIILSNYTKT
uniref:Ig-like domain-containing protein n=1 Tax=Oreochromis niloticus TaxID=8128 RepID=A0A669EJB6_ORENI